MTYLLVGEVDLTNKAINDLIKKHEISTNSISRYDMENDSIYDAIMDIDTFNLFDAKKMVIVYNISSVSDSDILIKYLDNQNDNILVLVSYAKLDERKNLTKILKSKSLVLECFNMDFTSYIKDMLKGYKISMSNIMLLIEYCNNDFGRITHEVEKLKMYKIDSKEILDSDIKKLVKKGLDKNVFDLIKELNNKNISKMFDIYYELVNNNEDEIKIISILANNYRLILQVKYLLDITSDDEIIKQLKLHPYRFKMLKQETFKYSHQELKDILKGLGDIDIEIKSGRKNKKVALELFLTKICS